MTDATAQQDEGPISAYALKSRQFGPLQFIVEGLIPVGLTILAGAPKARKSWLALDIALSVARGGACLDERKNLCPRGAVLYLALEDSERRLKDRIAQMLGQEPVWPSNLFFETSWPRLDADGLPRLREWIEATPEARLIVIDVFQKFRSATGSQTGYSKDYADLTDLLNLAREKEVGIVLVHHLRKSGGDPFDRMTGSTGILGVPDTLVVLDKQRGGTRLLVQGRDIGELALEIVFDAAAKRWRVARQPASISTHPERDRIVALMETASQPLSSKDIETATGQSADAVRQLLKRMVDSGEIEKVARGRYVARESTPQECTSADHDGHNDHIDHEACAAELARREEFETWSVNASDGDGADSAGTIDLLNSALDDWLARVKATKQAEKSECGDDS